MICRVTEFQRRFILSAMSSFSYKLHYYDSYTCILIQFYYMVYLFGYEID